MESAPTSRLCALTLGALVSVFSSGCGESAQRNAPPASPVGRFEETSYMAGFEKAADGTWTQKMVPQQRVTIDVRADHTLRYEWKNLAEPGKGEGRLEATWRAPTAKEAQGFEWPNPRAMWFIFGKGEPDRVRDLMETSGHIAWIQSQWMFPVVDTTSGRLTTAFTFPHRVGE